MLIYNNQGEELYNIVVDDSSYRYRSIMGKNDVELRFSLPEHIEIPIGSYINFQGERYTLWYPGNFEKKGTRIFEYTVTFISNKEMLRKYKYKLLSSFPYELKFSLTAKPARFIQLLVDNLNQRDSGWSVGECIEGSEKAMAFNYESCMDVLGRLAGEFETEWDITDKTISLRKVERFKGDPLALSYGKGHGFKSGVGRVSQGDKQPCTVLYVQGGERNIDYSSYRSKTLLLPKSQMLSREGRTYKTDADGMFITRADKTLTNYVEDGFDGSSFYPKRVGRVTEVIEVDENGKDIVKEEPGEGENPEEGEKPEEKTIFYDFKDSEIPGSLDYSKCRVNGERATIIFQSGILAGKEFDLVQADNDLTGYIHTERRFKIVPQEYDGVMMPSGDTFKISPDDTYAVFNISLPEAFVCDNETRTGASWDMLKEAVRYFYEHEDECFTFKGDLDGIWAKKHWLEIGGKIQPGGYVSFSDTQFQPQGVLIRITGVRDYINKPHSPQLELSNAPVSGTVLSDLGKLEGDEIITDNQHEEGLNFTKRRFRDAKETMRMLENAFLNFSAGTNPLWVHTMSVLIGDEQLQFQYVNNREEAKEVDHIYKYDKKKKVFETPGGIIQHLTLGVDTLSSEHKTADFKFWDIEAYTSPALDDPAPLYLFLKCEKEGTSGAFLLSKTAYKLDPGDGHYYFLTGTLGADIDNDRSFATTYGFTEIGPGWMRVKQIISPDGKTYFNVAMGEIGGKIVLKAGSSGLKELAEWTGVEDEIKKAQKTADEALGEIKDANDALEDLGNIIDGAFKDGIISEAEAIAIEKYINILKKEKADVDAVYAKLFANKYLEGLAKTDLLNAKITYNGVHSDLIEAINVAISDKQTTIEEKNEVDSQFVLYSSALANLSSRVEEANQAIQDKLKGFSDDAAERAAAAQKAADDAQQAADDATAEAEIITGILNEWASDKYISPMEKTSLKQQKSDILSEYQEIASQAIRYTLSETAAWNSYYNAYLSAINALDKYTADEPAEIPVDIDYGNISAYYACRKTMLDAIATASKKYVDDLKDSIGDITAGLQELAYLKEAIANETISIGGLLLTSLLKLGIKDGSVWTEKAGINGTAKIDSDVIAWFGGTLNQAINDTASIVFRLDGSGQVAGGAIRWYKDPKGVWQAVFNGAGKFMGSIGTPFLWGDLTDGSTIDLDANFNIVSNSTRNNPVSIKLPVHVKHNGTQCNICNPPSSSIRMRNRIRVSCEDGSKIWNTADIEEDMLSDIFIPSGKIAKFMAVASDQQGKVSWYCENYKDLSVVNLNVVFSATLQFSSNGTPGLVILQGKNMFNFDVLKISTGQYKITHSLDTRSYEVIATTAYNSSLHTNSFPMVANKDLNSFELLGVNADNAGRTDINISFVVIKCTF